jgi:hypothetical protein
MAKFGLEVEYGGPIPQVLTELREAQLTSHTGQHGYSGHSMTEWVVKYDASVSNGGEMVSPPLVFEDPDQRAQVNRAVAALKAGGGRTDSRAGIHVHIDASDLSAEQLAMVGRTFYKFQDVLWRLASSGWRTMRPGSTTFCRPLTDTQAQAFAKVKSEGQLIRAYYGRDMRDPRQQLGHGDSSRYYGLNLHSWFYRGTIEFRIFNSSVNADRIQAYIALCHALVEDARRGNKRSVNKTFPIGAMARGEVTEKAAYHRFQQVMRYEAGMDLADYKLMNRCWKDSVPQTWG